MQRGGGGGGGGGGRPVPVYSSRFGVPVMHVPIRLSRKVQLVLMPLTRSGVALPTIAYWTVGGEAPGFWPRYSAAAPATCGVACDVPEIVCGGGVRAGPADTMFTPGAWRSTHAPQFENEARASLMSVAPDGDGLDHPAGRDVLQRVDRLVAGGDRGRDAVGDHVAHRLCPAPRWRRHRGSCWRRRPGRAWWLPVTQSTPAMMALVSVELPQPNTRTATRVTSLAMPYVSPPTMPATWVPWPLQSAVLGDASTVLMPGDTRPLKSMLACRERRCR